MSKVVIDDGARHAAHVASGTPGATTANAAMTSTTPPAPYSRAAKRSAWKLLEERVASVAG